MSSEVVFLHIYPGSDRPAELPDDPVEILMEDHPADPNYFTPDKIDELYEEEIINGTFRQG